MRYILVVLIALLFSGCLTTTIPAKEEYRINPIQQTKILDVEGCTKYSLKVAQAFSSNALLSQSMYYAQGDTKQYMYSASKWATIPNRAITAEFLTLIRDSKLFKSVQTSKSRSRSDAILEINIEDFMQYFNNDSSQSYASVVVNLSLISAKGNSVFASETFRVKVDIDSLNASGGVDGLNKALSQVLVDSNDWLAKVCK